MRLPSILGPTETSLRNPAIMVRLFSRPSWSWVWLLLRVYLAMVWIEAGWEKLGDSAWWDGTAVQGFWQRAIVVPAPPARAAIAFGWWRDYIAWMANQGWAQGFGIAIAIGEFTVGIALATGAFTALAAAGAALMSWSFIMTGTASTNGALIGAALLLIVAWRTAGYWGLDRWLLPAAGTPWQPGIGWTRLRSSLPRRTRTSAKARDAESK